MIFNNFHVTLFSNIVLWILDNILKNTILQIKIERLKK